jgi:4-aminobutyrate aminotransferase
MVAHHPSSEIDGFFFSNSGAEQSKELKTLSSNRKAKHRRLPGAFTANGWYDVFDDFKTIYREGYQPLMPGVFVAPFPYAYRYGWDEEQTSRWCLGELEFLFVSQTAPQETAAILVETVLGEGGYVPPPRSFLKGLREICDRYNILLILDEIQSGYGRTGRWFAFEHYNVVPDIMTVAKGIASGLPLSGVLSRRELMDRWTPGSHGGTYGGNAVAAASAVATIQAMREDCMLENAQARGLQLISGLRHLQEDYPAIGDVRGLGLMIGSEFRTPDRQPDKATAKEIVHACFDRGLLLLTCGPWDNTVRWIPPLVVTEHQIRQALDIFGESLAEVLN